MPANAGAEAIWRSIDICPAFDRAFAMIARERKANVKSTILVSGALTAAILVAASLLIVWQSHRDSETPSLVRTPPPQTVGER
jgi:hypothetical protein